MTARSSVAPTALVDIGGKKYTIEALPMRPAKEWRAKLGGPFQQLASLLTSADTLELTNTRDMASIVDMFRGVLLGSIDLVLDLLFEYAPVLRADRERIEESGYDVEALEAFTEVLKLAYPLGQLRGLFRTLNGRSAPTTSKS
jgi:hypothetical protein